MRRVGARLGSQRRVISKVVLQPGRSERRTGVRDNIHLALLHLVNKQGMVFMHCLDRGVPAPDGLIRSAGDEAAVILVVQNVEGRHDAGHAELRTHEVAHVLGVSTNAARRPSAAPPYGYLPHQA